MHVREIFKRLKVKAGALAPALRVVRARWRTAVGTLLVIIGVTGIAVPFLSYSVARPSDVLLSGDLPAFTYPAGSPGIPTAGFGSNRLLIPEAGVSMPLLTGDLYESLEQGAWLTGSRPGLNGNTVIFGHRFKYLPPLTNTMFRLDKLDVGETFTVRWQNRSLVYRVSEVRVVEPTEVSVAGDFGDERVTLITCTPVWSTSHRLVVVGVPVEE